MLKTGKEIINTSTKVSNSAFLKKKSATKRRKKCAKAAEQRDNLLFQGHVWGCFTYHWHICRRTYTRKLYICTAQIPADLNKNHIKMIILKIIFHWRLKGKWNICLRIGWNSGPPTIEPWTEIDGWIDDLDTYDHDI